MRSLQGMHVYAKRVCKASKAWPGLLQASLAVTVKTSPSEASCHATPADPVQALMKEGILVSPRMMADHMPDYLTAVLRRMTKERGRPSTAGSGVVALDMEATDQGDPERLDH